MYIFQIILPPSLQAISELLGVKLEFGQIGSLNLSSKAHLIYVCVCVCVNILLEREGILGPLEIGSRVQIPKNQFGLV
jgi:hypothetical protein